MKYDKPTTKQIIKSSISSHVLAYAPRGMEQRSWDRLRGWADVGSDDIDVSFARVNGRVSCRLYILLDPPEVGVDQPGFSTSDMLHLTAQRTLVGEVVAFAAELGFMLKQLLQQGEKQ